MNSHDLEPIELERPSGSFEPKGDGRPRMPEPLPVKLVAVEDLRVRATVGLEVELDALYVDLLEFVKEPEGDVLVYRADNFCLRFDLQEGLVERDHYRTLQIVVQSLGEMERRLIEAEIEYTRQRGLTPGTESLALLDPAGNQVELVEARPLM